MAKYILIGGNPYNHSYTGMSVRASTDNPKELQSIWDLHYSRSGGLLLWLNTETGKSVDDIQAELPKKYRVPVEWKATGYIEVEAKNPIEAQNLVYDADLPDEWDFVDGTFGINPNEPIEKL